MFFFLKQHPSASSMVTPFTTPITWCLYGHLVILGTQQGRLLSLLLLQQTLEERKLPCTTSCSRHFLSIDRLSFVNSAFERSRVKRRLPPPLSSGGMEVRRVWISGVSDIQDGFTCLVPLKYTPPTDRKSVV